MNRREVNKIIRKVKKKEIRKGEAYYKLLQAGFTHEEIGVMFGVATGAVLAAIRQWRALNDEEYRRRIQQKIEKKLAS